MAKQIKLKITDIDALQSAYPALVNEETKVVKTVDRAKLYQIVKALKLAGETVPGVTIDADHPASEPEVVPAAHHGHHVG